MRLDEALGELPVVAIVRGVTPDEVLGIAEALYAAGVRAIEVPLNSPEPFESLRRLVDVYRGRMACGSGTVLTPENVEGVAQAGGRIVVAPNTDVAVIRRAVELDLDMAPGIGTATEAFQAVAAGARHLKLFPAASYGPGHLKQMKAVLPSEITVWAVGGVGPDDLAGWWSAGARAFGLGGELYKPGQTPAETHAKATRIVAAARRLGLS